MNNFALELGLGMSILLTLSAPGGPNVHATLVRDPAGIKSLQDALLLQSKENTLVKGQVVLVSENGNRFILAPYVSTNSANGGCHIHAATKDFRLTSSHVLAPNEDASSCDSVAAIFACQLKKDNAIGAIYGMRLALGFVRAIHERLIARFPVSK
jgi:hypothetical protein